MRHVTSRHVQNGQVDLGPDAAQSLQALAQGLFPNPHPILAVPPSPFPPHPPGIGDPGPSSHPRGPPNLGQLSAAAAAAVIQTPQIPTGPPDQEDEDPNKPDDPDKPKGSSSGSGSGRTRGNRPAAMGTDEWARQRKDNHVCPLIRDLFPSTDPLPRKKSSADDGET